MKSKFTLLPFLVIVILLGLNIDAQAVPSSTDGEQLFQEHCASCHGTEGKGSIGLPLSKTSVIESLTDDYIRYTIRAGRPGRLMPAFTTLTDAQVEAITQYMRSWGKENLIVDRAEGFSGDPKKGEALYQQNCEKCHGESLGGSDEGTGVTFSRKRKLEIMASALNNPGFLDAISDRALLHVIQQGRADTPMPSFKDKLSHEDTHHLISYIRSKKKIVRKDQATDNFTLVKLSPYGFDETVKLIQETVRSNNFRVFPNRFLEQGLADEFSVNKRQVIIRFCNFNKLFAALKIEPRLGTILPCKITIVEKKDGSVELLYTNVKAIAKIFNNDLLVEAFQDIEDSYNDILDEVTL